MRWNQISSLAAAIPAEAVIAALAIATLGAIAVPSYRNAELNTKLAQVEQHQRVMATAILSYHLDWNAMPRSHRIAPDSRKWLYSVLTTPIAYLPSLFEDPFNTVEQDPDNRLYTYWGPDYLLGDMDVITSGGLVPRPDLRERTARIFHPYYPAFTDGEKLLREDFFTIFSVGPDNRYSVLTPPDGAGGEWGSLPLTPYDPTNGAESYGDIVRNTLIPNYSASMPEQ